LLIVWHQFKLEGVEAINSFAALLTPIALSILVLKGAVYRAHD
jgi:hypothetical protein